MGIIEKAASRLGQATHETVIAPEVSKEPPSSPREHSSERETPPFAQRIAATYSKSTSKRVELDLAKLHEQGMITPDGGRSAVAEEFRAIKRTLLDRLVNERGEFSKRSNLIMVTSCVAGEGKTFCAINLAMSIAMELDHTVLLVDADVARPAMLRSLGLTVEGGLMDILLERRVQVPDVMLKTNVSTLSLLPTGASQRNATELLASKSMSKLLDEMANRYSDRVVIFDSPPLLLTSEARVLASQMGQIVLVVEAEKTTQKELKNALRQIEGCPNVNLVYNKAKAFSDGDEYGTYSYYN